MKARRLVRVAVVTTVLAVLAMMVQGTSFAASKATSRSASGRFLVVAKNSADYDALRAKALRGGANVVKDIPQIGTMLVKAPDSVRSSLAADSRTKGIARDHTIRVAQADPNVVSHLSAPGLRSAKRIDAKVWKRGSARTGITPDPGFSVPGLQWDFPRIGLPEGWKTTAGSPAVTVAVIAAADLGVDVVNISFGGYLNPNNPDEEVIYQAYVAAVAYARQHGTVIAAAAGNESRRIGAGGLVLSQGTLTAPGSPVDDQFGNFEVPGGIPGVVDVASTGNTVNAPSSTCPPGSTGTVDDVNATC